VAKILKIKQIYCAETAELVRNDPNTIGEVINLEQNAQTDFEALSWGIEVPQSPGDNVSG
jgi:hypothetical protein